MNEPTGCAGGCPRTNTYCDRCDLLVGLPGLRVVEVHAEKHRLVVTVESPPAEQGCRTCGVIAESSWPANSSAGGRAMLRPPGTGLVAEADLGLRRTGVPGQGLHRAARRCCSTARTADGAGVLVGG